MIDYIVYKTHTGFTESYAKMLSKQTGIPAISSDEAKKSLKSSSNIIFMGWIRAGQIRGLKRFRKNQNLKCVCGVGMTAPDKSLDERLVEQNKLENHPFFYLQGGFDLDKLDGLYKIIMEAAVKAINKETDDDDKNNEALQTMENGCNYVSMDKLTPIIKWVNANK
ncbi:MAG TPA: hypothetical protein GX401_07095 [Clostridiales bacterium]|nr:hypothetical protein [Clostridiales bacterium]